MTDPARKQAAERRRGASKADDKAAQRRSRRPQRDRLLDAMIVLATKAGYQNVSIAQISAEAGVSRATFYEQFEDKEDCLLEAYRAAAERLLAQGGPVVTTGDWSDAATDTLRELAHTLRRDPDAGRLLFVEILAGGSRAKNTVRAVVGAFEQGVREFIESTPSGADPLDIPPTAVVGAVRSITARYLRTHGEDELPALADDGITWLRCYGMPAGTVHWSTSADALLPEQSGQLATSRRPPTRLPRGRHGLAPGVIARSQRTRIIYATAEMMMAKGYKDTTVTDIVAAAGVSREVFYEHFSDKHHAFLEAQNHPTQHILDACAAAYFSASEWPERVWNTFDALLSIIAANPAISHLRLVECYVAGPDAIRRAEEITRSFTIFLEEGYSFRPEARDLPRLCSQAIAGAIFEVIQRRATRGDFAGLMRHLPQLTYIAIAPFTGAADAVRRVAELRDSRIAADLNAVGRQSSAQQLRSPSSRESLSIGETR